MAEQKTKITKQNVYDYIDTLSENEKKDALILTEFFTEATGCTPQMWGPTMIGFGEYHYKYKSKHEGDAMLTGFAMRKNKISLYLYISDEKGKELLSKLGKTTNGVACVYVKKLSDISFDVLNKLISHSIKFLEKEYGAENLRFF